MKYSECLTIISLPEVDSTNTHIKKNLLSFQKHQPCFLLAEKQNQGRGRDNRSWDSPAGGFYSTLVLEIPAQPTLSYGLISLMAGLGVCDVLSELAPLQYFDLKWPNDVLCCGRKIAGILVENQIKGQQWISLWGVGINLDRKSTPFSEELCQRAVSLSDLGIAAPNPINLALLLYQRFRHWLHIWNAGQIDNILAALNKASAACYHKPITIHDREGVCRGIFEKIDEQGALWLKLDSGETRICFTGEITYPVNNS